MTFPQPKGSLNSLSLLANMYADLLHSLETVLLDICLAYYNMNMF